MKYKVIFPRIRYKCYRVVIYSLIYLTFSFLSAKEFKIISLHDFGKIKHIKFQDESATQRISIRKYVPNRSFLVPENNLIHFYGINSETGDFSKKPLLRISFEGQEDDSIIFLQIDKDNPGKINYEFLKNDPLSFPLLSTMFINFSAKRIIAKIGSEVINLDPNSRKLIRLPKNERGSFSEKVTFAALKKDKNIDYFYSTFWRIPTGHKTLCIIDYISESDTHKITEILL